MIDSVTQVVKAYRALGALGKRIFRLEVRLETKPRAKRGGAKRAARAPRAPALVKTPVRKARARKAAKQLLLPGVGAAAPVAGA
jgi:hypothetical protein